MESSSKRKPHVVLFTSIGLGHIIPFAELAKLLAANHSCKVTFITYPWESTSPQQRILDSTCSGLDINLLDLTGMGTDDILGDRSQFHILIQRAQPSVEAAIRSLKDPVDAIIIDMFCLSMLDVSTKLGIPSYLFLVSGISVLVFMLSFPKFTDQHAQNLWNEESDMSICIEGLPDMRVQDLPKLLQNPANPAFETFANFGKPFTKFKGIFVNSFAELEEKALKTLRLGKGENLPESLPPVYAVGPVISKENNKQPCECLDWLDLQPPASVLYVSFGSEATLSRKQVTELALGLKGSGQRFLWVLRRPTSEDTGSAEYRVREDTVVSDVLPRGFLEETKERGMVVSSWVPQMAVLGHGAVGGFMYHAGWNSTLESIWHGVPSIVWPMFAEQRVNSRIITEEIGCGIQVTMEKDEFVKKEVVERCVRELMEGEAGVKVRKVATEVMQKAKDSVAHGGDAFCALGEAVSKWGRFDL